MKSSTIAQSSPTANNNNSQSPLKQLNTKQATLRTLWHHDKFTNEKNRIVILQARTKAGREHCKIRKIDQRSKLLILHQI